MNKKEILIIEDNKFQEIIFRKIISEIAANKKFEIISLYRGEDAIDHIINNLSRIALVILDISLPDISGFQVLEITRKLSKSLPVIILSANEEKDLIIRSIKLGANNYFIKGKNKEELEKFYLSISDLIVS